MNGARHVISNMSRLIGENYEKDNLHITFFCLIDVLQ